MTVCLVGAFPTTKLKRQFFPTLQQMAPTTPEAMLATLQTKGRPFASFHKGDTIEVKNTMVTNYSYTLTADPGKDFDPRFKPHFSPAEMLRLGVFEGKYLNDCLTEFPAEWFIDAIVLDKLRPQGADPSINLFRVKSRLPLDIWQSKGWVPHRGSKAAQHAGLSDPKLNVDERGWFQWYCRYWMGRRIPELDDIQIKRWRAFARHSGGVKKNCRAGDLTCRPVQRQALLQWAWDPFV
jgi:hypothetical protein